MEHITTYRGVYVIYYSYKGSTFRKSLKISASKRLDESDRSILLSNKNKLTKLITDYQHNHQQYPPVQYIKDRFKEENPYEGKELLKQFDEFKKYKLSSPKFQEQSIKEYNNLGTGLKDYGDSMNKELFLNHINLDFFNKFQYFLSKPRGENNEKGGLVSNTIRKRIKILIEFCKYIEEKNIHNFDINFKKIEVVNEDDRIEYETLSYEEMIKLSTLKLPRSKDKIRDIALFLGFTGIRYSDYHTIEPQHIVNNWLIKRTVKNNTQFKVPLNTICLNILEKYNGILPMVENQHFNKEIKLICELIPSMKKEKIVEKETYKRIIPIKKRRCDMISAHTFRRTFISICLSKNINIPDIMDMSSHKNVKTFIKYHHKFMNLTENTLNFSTD